MSMRKYQLDGEPISHLPGRLISVSSSLYEKDWKSIRHTHPFVELFYVKSGSGSFFIEDFYRRPKLSHSKRRTDYHKS